MNVNYKNLGKVCLTPAGIWNRDKKYERIDVVTHPITGFTYIAKQDVPKGISIDNDRYWQKIGSSGYKNNNFIILSDVDPKTGKLIHYNLSKAINSIHHEDRRPGMMLGFYGDRAVGSEIKSEWFLYQFNSNSIDDWNRLKCWVSVYNNVSHFKGYYVNEELLFAIEVYPEVGDFAFVGETVEETVLYICSKDGVWTNTEKSIVNLDYIDACIKNYIDSFNIENYINESIDSNLKKYVKEYVDEYLANLIPDGYELVIVKKDTENKEEDGEEDNEDDKEDTEDKEDKENTSANTIHVLSDDNSTYNNISVDENGDKQQVYSLN